MAPKKTTTEPKLDVDRRMTVDLRDPRSKAANWPCYAHHEPGNAQSNKFGQWFNCRVCGLRLSYVPKVGSPATHTATANPGNVTKALNELKDLLPEEFKPTEDMVKAAIEMVVAQERLKTMVEDFQTKLEETKNKAVRTFITERIAETIMPKAKTAPRATRTSEGYSEEPELQTPQSQASWIQVDEAQQMTFNPMDYLTPEELQRMMNLVNQRMTAASSTPIPDEQEEMEPHYFESQ